MKSNRMPDTKGITLRFVAVSERLNAWQLLALMNFLVRSGCWVLRSCIPQTLLGRRFDKVTDLAWVNIADVAVCSHAAIYLVHV